MTPKYPTDGDFNAAFNADIKAGLLTDDEIVQKLKASFPGLPREQYRQIVADARKKHGMAPIPTPPPAPPTEVEVEEVEATVTNALGDISTTAHVVDMVDMSAAENASQGVTGTFPHGSFFESIAIPLIERLDVEVAPCYPWDTVRITDGKEKKMGKTVHGGLVPSPLTMKSKDLAQIKAWGQAEPNANVAVYAEQKEDGLLFLDKDGAISLIQKYESETGKKFPQTLLVQSSLVSDGNGGGYSKGHWYFKQTPKTMALKKNITEAETGGLFSLRVNNQYVASIGSIHPNTGKPYVIVADNPVIPMPDEFLDWLLKQVDKPANTNGTNNEPERRLLTHGQMHPEIVEEAGRLWRRGYEADDVVEMVVKYILANSADSVDEAEVRKQAKDVTERYKRGEAPGTTKRLRINN